MIYTMPGTLSGTMMFNGPSMYPQYLSDLTVVWYPLRVCSGFTYRVYRQ